MSSKRKSPPSKLQEGSGSGSADGGEVTSGGGEGSDLEPVMEAVAAHAHLASSGYYKMSSRSSTGSEPEVDDRRTPPQPTAEPPSVFYKLSSASSSSGASGSEVEDMLGADDELLRSPSNKRKREDVPENCAGNAEECARYYQMNCLPKPVMTPNSLQALLSLNQAGYLDDRERLLSPPARRRRSGCESPSEADKKALLHLNNNSTTLNHNNSNSGKRSMDDVLKRLTSKMNNSTIREERRPGSPPKMG